MRHSLLKTLFLLLCVMPIAQAQEPLSAGSGEYIPGGLIGKTLDYSSISVSNRVIPESNGCLEKGGGTIQIRGKVYQNYGISGISCSGRLVYLMVEDVAYRKFKVLDEIAIPIGMEDHVYGEDCQLKGDKLGSFLITIAKFGKRYWIDGRNGVIKAWIPNVDKGKFEVLPTRSVYCTREDGV